MLTKMVLLFMITLIWRWNFGIWEQLEHFPSESDKSRSVQFQKYIILYEFEDNLEISLNSKFVHWCQR